MAPCGDKYFIHQTVIYLILQGDTLHKIQVNVGTSVTEANRRQADENREHLDEHGIRAIDILGAVGSGKTMLIEKLTPVLRQRGKRSAPSSGTATATTTTSACTR